MIKITLIVLGLALVGVSAAFVFDHTSLTKRLASTNAALSLLQEKSARQTKTATILINCANTTEKTYVDTKKYVSVVSCFKAGLR